MSDFFKLKANSVFSGGKVEDEEKLLQSSGEEGDIEEVKRLLSCGMVDVTCEGRAGNPYTTPLGDAAYFGQQDIIKILLDAGADPDKEFGDEDKTPLHLADKGTGGWRGGS